jgi:anti-sigma-K factor RskA
MTEPDIHALSGAYAVDALDELERARFEQHLAACTECRAEVNSLRETTVGLSELTSTPPPPALRASILSEIRTIRPLPPEVSQPSAAPRRRSRLVRLAAAAALIATAGVGTAIVLHQTENGASQVTSLSAQVLHAADAREVDVDLPGPALARMVRSVSVGRAVLVTRDMPAPPAGKVYQLWLQDPAGRMVSAGLMPSGGSQTVVLQGNASEAKAAGITVEPAAGSVQPTSAPLALFDFAQAT